MVVEQCALLHMFFGNDQGVPLLEHVCALIRTNRYLLLHLLIAGCDIGVEISVRPFVHSSIRPSVRPSTVTSKFGFLNIRGCCESET